MYRNEAIQGGKNTTPKLFNDETLKTNSNEVALVLSTNFSPAFNTILHFKIHKPGYRRQTTQRAATTCPGSRGLPDNPEQGHLPTSLLEPAARIYFGFCSKCLALTHTNPLFNSSCPGFAVPQIMTLYY